MTFLGRAALPRRALLRGISGGVAVGVALPWLDAMTARSARAQTTPRRFVAFFKPNGMSAYRADAFSNQEADNWTPRQTGAGWAMTPLLKPFADRGLKNDITVLSGVNNEILTTTGRLAHDGQTTLLGPYQPVKIGTGSFDSGAGGRSMDLMIADKIGAGARFPSINAGIYLAACTPEKGASLCIYFSYTAKGTPNPAERFPAKLWSKLFAGGATNGTVDPAALERLRRQRQSVLDGVRDSAAALKTRLGVGDRARLDQHLESLRSIEANLTNIQSIAACPAPAQPPSTLVERPENIPAIAKAQIDMVVTALACDLTRVGTILLHGGANESVYTFLGVPGGHHTLTHGGSKILTDKVDLWQTDQIAYLVESLKKVDEGGKSLLDATVVFAGSDVAGGWHHNEGGWAWGGENRAKGSPLDHGYLLAGGTHYFKHGTHVRFKGGTVTHVQLLQSIYSAVTGIEGAAASAWMEQRFVHGPMPGLRGDRSADMIDRPA